MKTFLAWLLLLAPALSAQVVSYHLQDTDHVFPAQDTNNQFTGSNYFDQVNGDYVVGPQMYSTIQSALTAACTAPTEVPAQVEIKGAAVTSESIAKLIGCSGVDLVDQRSVPSAYYIWTGSNFVPALYTAGNLSAVAYSGKYSDLLGLPTFAKVAASGSYTDLLNRPVLAPVASSGSYTDLTNVPSLASVASSGLASDLKGLGKYVIVNCSSGDYTSCLGSAILLNPGATFGLWSPGTLGSVNLQSGQNLDINTALSFTGSITQTGSSVVHCGPQAVLTNAGIPSVTGLFSPFIIGSGTTSLHVYGCDFEGPTGTASEVYGSNGQNLNVHINGIVAHNVALYKQNSAAPSAPSLGLNVSDNVNIWDTLSGQDAASVLIYGAMQNWMVTGNQFVKASNGLEAFTTGASGAPANSNPGYADIVAANLSYGLFSNNHCTAMGATCGWVNVASHVSFKGNFAYGCGDTCFDQEATVDSDIIDNTSQGSGNFDISNFYTSVGNSIRNNHITSSGEIGIAIKNAGGYNNIVSQLTITGNDFKTNGGFEGIFSYMEAAQDWVIASNQIENGQLVFTTFEDNYKILSNAIDVTATLPYNGIGPGNNPGIGLPAPNQNQNGGYGIVQDNVVTTQVAQSNVSPCMSGGLSNPNPGINMQFLGNTCSGAWSVDVALSSGSTNVSPTFVLRNNNLVTGNITKSASNGVQPTVVSSGNYTTTGTTSF